MAPRALLVLTAVLAAAAASADTPSLSMAADDQGGAVFGFPHGSPTNHIRARWLSPAGTLGSQIRVSTAVSAHAVLNDVAVDALGNATFCWQDHDVAARRMPLGAPGLSQIVLVPQEGSVPSPDIAANASGHAVCVWRTQYTAPPDTLYQIHARTLPADGSYGLHREISSDASLENAQSQHVAVAPDGTATIVWWSNARVLVRQLAPDGTLGSIYAFASGTLFFSDPLVAVDPSGIATVLWQDVDAANYIRTYARRLGPGGIVSTPRTLSPTGMGSMGPSLDVDAAGNAVVVFGTYTTTESGPVLLRRLAADGTVGPVETVSTPVDPVSALPVVAVAPTGEATITWTQGGAARARRIAPDGTGGPVLLLSSPGQARKVDVGATGVATFLFMSGPAVRTRQLDAAGNLGPNLIVTYQ
jgi:hypothetical protein